MVVYKPRDVSTLVTLLDRDSSRGGSTLPLRWWGYKMSRVKTAFKTMFELVKHMSGAGKVCPKYSMAGLVKQHAGGAWKKL